MKHGLVRKVLSNIKVMGCIVFLIAFMMIVIGKAPPQNIDSWANVLNFFTNELLVTFGGIIITLVISIPIAIHFQSKQNSASFKILSTCSKADIISIFISRKEDVADLRRAIDDAAIRTSSIMLLGVAFPSFLDLGTLHDTQIVKEKLKNHNVKLQILLLAPKSPAADRRSEIEVGSDTQGNIKKSLNNHIVGILQERVKNHSELSKFDVQDWKTKFYTSHKKMDVLINKLKVEVRLYDLDPVVFFMGFDSSIFVEQYHFGCPQQHVPSRGCVGGYMPVIQYNRNSKVSDFLLAHFAYLWNTSNSTKTTPLGSVTNQTGVVTYGRVSPGEEEGGAEMIPSSSPNAALGLFENTNEENVASALESTFGETAAAEDGIMIELFNRLVENIEKSQAAQKRSIL